MDMILFQENEQRRLQEEKMERRRKAQAEMKTKRSGKTACFLALTIVKGAYLTFNNVNLFSSIVNLRYSPVLGPTSTRQWV